VNRNRIVSSNSFCTLNPKRRGLQAKIKLKLFRESYMTSYYKCLNNNEFYKNKINRLIYFEMQKIIKTFLFALDMK
jgi:hypothetical protein